MEREIRIARTEPAREMQSINLTVTVEGPLYVLAVKPAPFDDIHCSADNLFDLLVAFRKCLEIQGWRLLFKASRPDVAVSNAYRNQHGGGEDIYLLTLGQAATSKNMVNIFGPAEFEETGSVAEQQEF